ncbi:MAG: ABC transporter ATP-binding protein [Cloacibacterium sp.]|nr:ABC transporter ATP-binding protein [Cloacibacterium sp.]
MQKFLHIQDAAIGYQSPLIAHVESSLDLGEICLLIGNNGVGKTTLIKSILAQIPLLNGEVFINEKNIKNLTNKEIAQQIAIVFSKSYVPMHYTLVDLISLGKYIHYPYYFELNKKDLEEIDEIVEKLNLCEYRNLPLRKLSDGNLQKAFIGRALAQNSPMIVLDEPTTHLDEDNKVMILALLRTLAKKQNKLILFSSHDWRLAKEFSDKIWWIQDKKLVSGITEDVLLSHQFLVHPKLFSLNSNFVAPEITAPLLEKEMLYSALQKNIEKDLSSLTISFDRDKWWINSRGFSSIEELISCLLEKFQKE